MEKERSDHQLEKESMEQQNAQLQQEVMRLGELAYSARELREQIDSLKAKLSTAEDKITQAWIYRCVQYSSGLASTTT